MKKFTYTAAISILLATSLLFTSCIGSFSLTNKVMTWNNQVGNKFVNELVFFAFWILPVYEVTGLADLLVLNSIEFWSGSNPLEAGVKVIDTEQGRYLVECDGKGYTVTEQLTGQSMRLDFEDEEKSWYVDYNGESYKLLTFVDNTHVRLPDGNGGTCEIELTASGVSNYANIAKKYNSEDRLYAYK